AETVVSESAAGGRAAIGDHAVNGHVGRAIDGRDARRGRGRDRQTAQRQRVRRDRINSWAVYVQRAVGIVGVGQGGGESERRAACAVEGDILCDARRDRRRIAQG